MGLLYIVIWNVKTRCCIQYIVFKLLSNIDILEESAARIGNWIVSSHFCFPASKQKSAIF